MVQLVKNLPAMQEAWVQFLCQEDPLERNGNPFQYSGLENPMNRGAWQTTVHGVKRVGHDLVTKPPPPPYINEYFNCIKEFLFFKHLPITNS